MPFVTAQHFRALALLLAAQARLSHGRLAFLSRHSPEQAARSCSELVNHGSHFTVDIEVGTPGQRFSVVADTGSNTLIVPSCQCQASGYCSTDDRCFTGTNRSSTFSLVHGLNGPERLMISFGSGPVEGIVARETVRAGQISAHMQKGIMLMTAHRLNFGGPFEGILGLGVPQRPAPEAPTGGAGGNASAGAAAGIGDSSSIQDIIRQIAEALGRGGGGDPSASGLGADDLALAKQMPGTPPTGFLEQAGISRFSMCFNDGANGVLRLGTPAAPLAHGSVGVEHWGLGLHGISIGAQKVPVKICRPQDMLPGQDTPCGAIPDSGTTLITAPEQHIMHLLSHLCDQWPRCRQNHTAMERAAKAASNAAAGEYGFDPFDIKVPGKNIILRLLLADCASWSSEASDFDELPPLHFDVAGSNGTKQTLTLPGFAYVLESHQNDTDNVSIHSLHGGSPNRTCAPAFGKLDYQTQKHGPVWIFGTSFFYQFTVGYDLSATPPSISFRPADEAPCGTCDGEVGLVTASAGPARARRPRGWNGVARSPSVDTSRPL